MLTLWTDCFIIQSNGNRQPGNHHWEGMRSDEPTRDWRFAKPGDRIGMLLDLDQGSITIHKDDVKLGVLQAEGLSGEYC